MRIVLYIPSARVSLDRLARPALVEHQVVEILRRLLISFEAIVHTSDYAERG